MSAGGLGGTGGSAPNLLSLRTTTWADDVKGGLGGGGAGGVAAAASLLASARLASWRLAPSSLVLDAEGGEALCAPRARGATQLTPPAHALTAADSG